MITKEKAQQCIEGLDIVSRGGLPINSLGFIINIAQTLQSHIDSIEKEEKGKKCDKDPDKEPVN